MTILDRFDTPGRVAEPSDADRDAWNATVKSVFAGAGAGRPQIYDPTEEDTPDNAQVVPIAWPAFPATVSQATNSPRERWTIADANRTVQDEYCEWAVERAPNGDITRVTFTSETPEYFQHLARRDRANNTTRLLDFYHQFVSVDVKIENLFDGDQYDPANEWNSSTTGRPAHLMQGSNNLGAAVSLVADSTIQRELNGNRIDTKQGLAVCAGLGSRFRNSDPQIAIKVNQAARSGATLTFADPPGLYLDGISTARMRTPDDTDPASFWTVERGEPGLAVRASFAVPPELGYTVSQIRLGNGVIEFGAQLADLIDVRVSAVVKPATHVPVVVACGAALP